MKDEDQPQQEIGTIGNYYGGLSVKEDGGKFFWSIENYDGHDWEEIPENLYRELTGFEKARRELAKQEPKP